MKAVPTSIKFLVLYMVIVIGYILYEITLGDNQAKEAFDLYNLGLVYDGINFIAVAGAVLLLVLLWFKEKNFYPVAMGWLTIDFFSTLLFCVLYFINLDVLISAENDPALQEYMSSTAGLVAWGVQISLYLALILYFIYAVHKHKLVLTGNGPISIEEKKEYKSFGIKVLIACLVIAAAGAGVYMGVADKKAMNESFYMKENSNVRAGGSFASTSESLTDEQLRELLENPERNTLVISLNSIGSTIVLVEEDWMGDDLYVLDQELTVYEQTKKEQYQSLKDEVEGIFADADLKQETISNYQYDLEYFNDQIVLTDSLNNAKKQIDAVAESLGVPSDDESQGGSNWWETDEEYVNNLKLATSITEDINAIYKTSTKLREAMIEKLKADDVEGSIAVYNDIQVIDYILNWHNTAYETLAKSLYATEQKYAEQGLASEDAPSHKPTSLIDIKDQVQDIVQDVADISENLDADTLYFRAQDFEDAEDIENAVKYYRLAAEKYPEDNGERYEALAQAEWELENPDGILKYLEQGYVVDPTNDYLLHTYGHFLNGISLSSAYRQDLDLALKINLELVSLLPDDENLDNLAYTYLLRGEEDKFEETVGRMSVYDESEHYGWYAKIYHRRGNQEMAEKYKNLAIGVDDWNDEREQYLSLSF
tara:strand:- start:17104 stop:19062 length:1959 start_codon:yes stop_codon:yes gene_type:complete